MNIETEHYHNPRYADKSEGIRPPIWPPYGPIWPPYDRVGAGLWWVLPAGGCCFQVSDFFQTPDQYACSGKSLYGIGCCLLLVAVYYWLLSTIGCCLLLGAVYYWLLSTIGCCFRVSVFF